MSYAIEVRPAALRALKAIDRQDQPRIHGAIALLAADPRPPGARALRGRDALRIRVGDYRIIYTVQDDRLLVVVVTLGHRRDVARPAKRVGGWAALMPQRSPHDRPISQILDELREDRV